MAYKLEEFPWSQNYNSDLREVLALLSKVLDDYDALYDRLSTAESNIATLQSDMDTLESDMAALETAMEKFKSDLESEFTELSNDIDDKFATEKAEIEETLTEKLAEILVTVNELFDTFKTDFTSLLNSEITTVNTTIIKLRSNLESSINELWNYIEEVAPTDMTNPLTLKRDTIPNVVTYLYEHASREHCLYNFEYKSLGWTNAEYAERHIVNEKYALLSRDYVHRFYWFRALHPVYGTRTWTSNVYSFLATLLLNTISVEDYAALDLTDEEYDALMLTNADYLSSFNEQGGLTNNEYGRLYIDNNCNIIREGI